MSRNLLGRGISFKSSVFVLSNVSRVRHHSLGGVYCEESMVYASFALVLNPKQPAPTCKSTVSSSRMLSGQGD